MEKTRMYFCKEPDGGELAVLVDQANGQKVTVYAHDGQHSEADVEYVKTCEPLSKPEESDLYKELVGQGYSDIEVVKKFKDDAATETPVDECVNKMVESVIGGSPICESVKKLASVIFEGMVVPEYENDVDFDDPSQVYEALLEKELFTQAELDLVTNGWGLNLDTLNTVCQVRYGMDADQVLEENA